MGATQEYVSYCLSLIVYPVIAKAYHQISMAMCEREVSRLRKSISFTQLSQKSSVF